MNDEELLKYYYDELIMSLITMSLPAEEQKYMIGMIGCVGDEFLEDYDNFYCIRRQVYIDNKVFNEEQLKVLDDFNLFLDKYSGHDQKFYWDMEELKNNPLWGELRQEAKYVLSKIINKKYKIEIQREYKKNVEYTKRKLVELDG